ncbi:CDP-diacylglycerol--glycerol-3-phosphate 3-phosphatidyltransferase 2-like [Curcuma longa]|uniref:CDP-diacylglycerol--glycerol-3-phosphate 3-phosphatidyltransferase 2-like n=1 Tax=Curcuma longa TaxID=136217 RepID=UPI003D9F585D
MPPPFPSSALLKAAVSFPPRHYHQHPPSSLLHGRKQQPQHKLSPAHTRFGGDTGSVALNLPVAQRRHFVALTSGSAFRDSARRTVVGSWWMRPESERPTIGRSSLGTRNWAAAGSDRGGGSGDKERLQILGSPDHGLLDSNGSHPLWEKKEKRDSGPPTSLLTLPTLLTLGRVAAVPLIVCTYYMNGWWATTATTSIFVAAAFTDWLDGYIARKKHLGTAFGAFLDPVADKLMVAATLVLLCTTPLEPSTFGEAPWLLTIPSIAIIGREITMSAVREWAASQDSKILQAVAVNKLGKWKTATQMAALTILLATRDSNLAGISWLFTSGVILLYTSAALAVWSLVAYVKNIWRFMLV